jgi:tetratricopeptide (TPR) repeat protein
VPIAGATFGGADMSQKYGESLGGAEAHVCLGHNPLSERIAEEGLEAALYWLEKHPSHSGDTKAAMLVDAAHHLDHDDDSDVPERLLRAAVALQPASADAQLALIELYSELERTDDALAVAIEHDRFVRVWIKRVGLLGEAERLDELRAALAESRSEALLGTDLYNLGFLLHEAGRKEAALLVYEAALAFPDVPSFAFNNVIIVASELELHERASALADRAQAVAEDNNYIYHSAACAYVAVGELDKALDQVKRAVASGYEHLDRLRVDEELGPLLRLPEFQALFADVP